SRTPAAGFSGFVDPEAAAAVFEAGGPRTGVGVARTPQARVTGGVMDRIAAVGSPRTDVVTQLLRFYGRSYAMPDGPPLHDPCAVARVIDAEVVACREAFVAVETQGRWTRGMTVVDFAGRLGQQANASVATTLDVGRFW